MLEKFVFNPTVATIITFLVVAIVAFVRGTVRSGAACDTEMKAIKELYEVQMSDMRDRVQIANERADQWMEIAMRATGAAKDLIEVARDRDRGPEREGRR